VSDADPKVEGNKPKEVVPLDDTPEAQKTADILNKVVPKTYEMIKDHPVNLERIENGEPPANIVIPRGAGAVPSVPSINEKYGVNSACIAETGLIMGIGRFAGMDIIEMEDVTGGVDTNLYNIRDTILDQVKNSDHDFFLINIDGADEAGHDGDTQAKVDFLEKVDEIVMSELLKLEDVYIFLTADHCTPISVLNHSGDPVPILINGPEVRVDDVTEYHEYATAKGGLCRIRGADVMNIMMDLMNYAHKFGA
jgi:2,3-bisphosphoglycerate-independent phosphoglycerate mutase